MSVALSNNTFGSHAQDLNPLKVLRESALLNAVAHLGYLGWYGLMYRSRRVVFLLSVKGNSLRFSKGQALDFGVTKEEWDKPQRFPGFAPPRLFLL
eukprot:5111329-Amphidinium_carterae.1